MFLATQDKPFFPDELEAKFACAKRMGFDGFEIDGRVLMERAALVEKASSAAGLPVRAVCGGYGGWIGDFSEERRQQGLKDIARILEIAGGMGVAGIVVPAAWYGGRGLCKHRTPHYTRRGILRFHRFSFI